MKKELYKQKNEVVNDAFDRLAVSIYLKNKQYGYKTIMLCGSEPGVGTTTIAIDLAISMASAGWKTVLVDCDLRKDAAYKRLSDKVELGLFEYLSGRLAKDELILNTNHKNLDYISNGRGMGGQVSLLCSANLQELLVELRNEYDYVILDVPAFSSSVDCNILAAQVDAVVLISAQEDSSSKAVDMARERLSNAGAKIIGVVVNKVNSDSYKNAISDYDYFLRKKYKKEVNGHNGGKK